MSSYVVNDETISVIIKALEVYEVIEKNIDALDEERTKIGQMLLDRNIESCNETHKKYEDDEDDEEEDNAFHFKDVNIKTSKGYINTGLVFGCVQCYLYNAFADYNYYDGSEIIELLNKLVSHMLEEYIRKDGYEIKWGYKKRFYNI